MRFKLNHLTALERAHGVKFRLKALFLMSNTITSIFDEYSKILVNLGISSETHQYQMNGNNFQNFTIVSQIISVT